METLSGLIIDIGTGGMFTFVCLCAIFYILLDSWLRRYKKAEHELSRWITNFSLYLTNTLVAYTLLVLFGFQVENEAIEAGFGFFRQFPNSPFILQLLCYALLLDFFVYWLHRAFHRWAPMWRLHLVHHSDLDLDFSVSFRFHPLERIFDIPLVMLTAVLLGVDLLVLFTYNIVYSFYAFFPHSNMRVAPSLDRILKLLVVTPDMHRVHHSSNIEETNSNYGDVFSIWDRLFGTFRHLPIEQQHELVLGLEYFRSMKKQGPLMALLQPILYKPEMSQNQVNDKTQAGRKTDSVTT